MLRLLMHLLGRPYEICKSCETLKIQLELANAERKELLSTIMGLVKPEVIQVAPTVTTPVLHKAMPFEQRRRILEQEDKIKASINRRIEKEENALSELNKVLEEKKDATKGN